MGPKYPPDFYDNETLAALTQTYREVWKTVVLKDPFRDFGKDEKLRQNIVHTMMELIAKGMLNVDKLRDRTLEKEATSCEFPTPARPQRRRTSKVA
jgi:hypothetical protein